MSTRDEELVRTRLDKRGSNPSNALPRHTKARLNGYPPRGSAVFSWGAAQDFEVAEPEPVQGTFPKRFLGFALGELGSPRRLLHVCSGTLGRDVPGVRVDIRTAARPDVVADGRALPFASDVFDAVLIDPPYSVEYAEGLYGVEYARPSHLLREAARVLRPGGLAGIIHFIVPMATEDLERVRVFGITTGPGYRIRAFSVLRKPELGLFADHRGGTT